MHEIWKNRFGWGFSMNPYHKRQIPWHRLGTLVEKKMPVDEAVRLFAPHHVSTLWKPVTFENIETGEQIEVETPFRAVMRETDGYYVYDFVSTGFVHVTHQELALRAQDLIDTGAFELDTIGSLRNGRVVFYNLRPVNHEVYKISGDDHKNYVVIMLDYKSGRGIKIVHTTVRVVCMNTLSMALNSGAVKKIVRKSGVAGQIDATVQQIIAGIQMNAEHLNSFATQAATEPTVMKWIDSNFPVETLPKEIDRDIPVIEYLKRVHPNAPANELVNYQYRALAGQVLESSTTMYEFIAAMSEVYEHTLPKSGIVTPAAATSIAIGAKADAIRKMWEA